MIERKIFKPLKMVLFKTHGDKVHEQLDNKMVESDHRY